MRKITIAIASHKPYWMPQDDMYMPVQVGALGKQSLGWQRDDAGEHISQKNATFCELTALYWLWKNVDADMYGLAHYRRYLAAGCPFVSKRKQMLSEAQAERLLARTDVLLPKKRHYWIETNESQYVHAHNAQDLIQTRKTLAKLYPAYLPAWDAVMQRRSGHRFNMFIMRKTLFQPYCAWLFSILFQVEKDLDISHYTAKDQRVFGYLSERLLDVWLLHHQVRYREVRVVHLETQRWGNKIVNFLKRKFTYQRQ